MDNAHARAESVEPSAGVGIMFGDCGDGETLGGIDLDSCRDPRTGKLTTWAQRIVDRLDTYTEVSPSKAGVKAFFLVPTEDNLRGGKFIKEGHKDEDHPPAIEVYTSSRYFTVTGDVIVDVPLRKINADLFHWLMEQGRSLEGRGTPKYAGADDLAVLVRKQPLGFTREAIEYICKHIPAENNYWPWLRVGMMLHHEYEGSDEGLEFWDSLCVDLPDYDRDEIDRKWKSFGRHPDPLRLSTLLMEAREHEDWNEGEYLRLNGGADLDSAGGKATPEIELHLWRAPDPRTIPPREFLYGRAYIRGFVSALVAPGGAAKTALTITEALSMVAGRDLFNIADGKAAPLHAPLNVCLWNLEDDIDEMERRIAAATIHFSAALDGADPKGRLYVNAASESLKIGRLLRGVAQLDRETMKALVAALRERRIDVLIVDPFISSHGVSENDNDAIDLIVKEGWGYVARQAECSVTLVHHTRKAPAGARGADVSIEDGRGASALKDACRYSRVINRLGVEEAPKLGVDPEIAWAYLRTDPGKGNLAPPGAAVWRRLRSVVLPNGTFERDNADNLGVVEAWTPPDLSKTTGGERERVVEAMGEQAWRQNVQAEGWVGVAFAAALDLDLDDPLHKAAVVAKVKAAIKTGWLEAFDEPVGGKPRPMVRAKQRRRPTVQELVGP